jgi:hypothetical protein
VSASDVARRRLAALLLAVLGAERRDDLAARRAALTDLRGLLPKWRREWDALPVDDRTRARVEGWCETRV